MGTICVIIAVQFWLMTIACGSGVVTFKKERNAVLASWVFLAIGIGFFAIALKD